MRQNGHKQNNLHGCPGPDFAPPGWERHVEFAAPPPESHPAGLEVSRQRGQLWGSSNFMCQGVDSPCHQCQWGQRVLMSPTPRSPGDACSCLPATGTLPWPPARRRAAMGTRGIVPALRRLSRSGAPALTRVPPGHRAHPSLSPRRALREPPRPSVPRCPPGSLFP